MKRSVFLVFFFMISLRVVAQPGYTLSGYVLDDLQGKPMPNVNVYISNSLLGAMTDESGYYKITGIHKGEFEVVASLVGFESQSHIVFFDDVKQLKKDFRLNPKIYVLDGVSITARDPKEWRRNYGLFRELFLGKSAFANECEIENKELIDFKWEGPDVLTASAKAPLIIVNNALGFRLNCILEKFRWDTANKKLNYIVKQGFSLLKPLDMKDSLKWKRNRIKAYEYSIERFLGDLISKDYYKDGYKIFIDPVPVVENNTSMNSERISSEELVYKSNNDEYKLSFRNFLRIEYDHETTWLRMLYPEITMDTKGNARELIPFQVYGAWSTQGVANMLPQYFEAE